RLAHHGWRLAVEEMGTAGQIAVLFGDVGWLALARVRRGDDGPAVDGDGAGVVAPAASVPPGARGGGGVDRSGDIGPSGGRGRCRVGGPDPRTRQRIRGDRGGRDAGWGATSDACNVLGR